MSDPYTPARPIYKTKLVITLLHPASFNPVTASMDDLLTEAEMGCAIAVNKSLVSSDPLEEGKVKEELQAIGADVTFFDPADLPDDPRQCIAGWLDYLKPTPLESSPDAAEEWAIDAAMAEKAEKSNPDKE